MADPVLETETFIEDVDKIHRFTNGAANETVDVIGGTIPTLRKFLADWSEIITEDIGEVVFPILAAPTGATLIGTPTGTVQANLDVRPTVTQIAAPSFADSIGFSPSGIGAVDTTVGNFLDSMVQYPSGFLYVEHGAKVNRLADRLFVGGAAVNVGNNVTVTPDWLTTYQLAKGRTNGFIQSAQSAILSSTNVNFQNGANALVLGAETRYLFDGYNAAGLIAIGVANKTSGAGHAYAIYSEAYRDLGATGGAYGHEIDAMNYAGLAVTDPYQQATGQVIALQIASGGELPAAGQFDVSAAINIQKNIGSTFTRGIVFGWDSITLSGGLGEAIALANGHKLQWYNGAGVRTNSIYSVATTLANSIEQRFVNDAVNFRTHLGKPVFQISAAAGGNGVNYLSAQGADTGGVPTLAAAGDDANIDLRLLPKATGVVWLGAYTAGAPVATGYTTVKSNSGVVLKLLTAL